MLLNGRDMRIMALSLFYVHHDYGCCLDKTWPTACIPLRLRGRSVPILNFRIEQLLGTLGGPFAPSSFMDFLKRPPHENFLT